jgi:hypothetical protein
MAYMKAGWAGREVPGRRDDVDGTDGAESIYFSYDGVPYAIDLTAANRVAFDQVMQPYIEWSRRLRKRGPDEPPSDIPGPDDLTVFLDQIAAAALVPHDMSDLDDADDQDDLDDLDGP